MIAVIENISKTKNTWLDELIHLPNILEWKWKSLTHWLHEVQCEVLGNLYYKQVGQILFQSILWIALNRLVSNKKYTKWIIVNPLYHNGSLISKRALISSLYYPILVANLKY